MGARASAQPEPLIAMLLLPLLDWKHPQQHRMQLSSSFTHRTLLAAPYTCPAHTEVTMGHSHPRRSFWPSIPSISSGVAALNSPHFGTKIGSLPESNLCFPEQAVVTFPIKM